MENEMTTKTVHVPSISCGHCTSTIEREIGALPGVAAVEASQDQKRVTITWDPDATDWRVIESEMTEIDHPPEDATE